jgi:TolB protein
MHDHREALALAAAAIDFELDAAERSQLDAALETCPLCRRQAAAMRATATILRRPSDIGTPARVRDVVIGVAMRGGRRTPALRSLLAASLSLLLILGGTAVLIGNRGLNILPPSESASPPIQTTTAPASPTVSPSAAAQSSPVASPIPSEPVPSSATETAPASSPSPVDDGPLRAGEIAAMVSDGRLVIRTKPGTGADSAIFKTKIYPGQRVLTIEGPVDASGYPWFRVRVGVIEGWVAAAAVDGEPWLAPVRSGLIAFVREATGGSGEAIVTVGPDGTAGEAVLLAEPNLVRYEQLAWSPDGRRLAFVGTLADAVNGSSEIFVVDANGSNLVQLTRNEVDDDSPAWSPDNTQIAFRRMDPDLSAPVDANVVVVQVDGSGARVLGPGANPVWSPDGLQLAMTVWDGSFTRVWVQAAGGGDRRQVSDASVASAPPAWSPDGQHLVVSSSGLILIEVASGSITPLTTEPGSMPTWSIGGTIAFSTTGSASPGVFVVASDGSSLRRVSGDLRFATAPEWSPDGRRLLLGGEGGLPALVDPGSGNLTVLGNDVDTIRSPAWQPRLP